MRNNITNDALTFGAMFLGIIICLLVYVGFNLYIFTVLQLFVGEAVGMVITGACIERLFFQSKRQRDGGYYVR